MIPSTKVETNKCLKYMDNEVDHMSKFEAIYNRKSVRDYSPKSLSKEELSAIKDKIDDLDPLYKNIDWDILLAEEGKKVQTTFSGLTSKFAKVEAPHYLIGTSETRKGHLVNTGFLLEDLVLYLTDREVGTCWIGAGINEDLLDDIYDLKYDLVIMVAFGDSVEGKSNLRKDPSEAKRKSLDELVINDMEEIQEPWKDILKTVRIAPSAVNSQPWRFFYEDDEIHVYIEKGGMFKKLMGKIGDLDRLNHIDVGIALKHLEIGALYHSKDIRFLDQERKKSGYEYIISARLE